MTPDSWQTLHRAWVIVGLAIVVLYSIRWFWPKRIPDFTARVIRRLPRATPGPSHHEFYEALGWLAVGVIGLLFSYTPLAKSCNDIRDNLLYSTNVTTRPTQAAQTNQTSQTVQSGKAADEYVRSQCRDWYALVAFSIAVFVVVLELLRIAWKAGYPGVSTLAQGLFWFVWIVFLFHVITAVPDFFNILGKHLGLN